MKIIDRFLVSFGFFLITFSLLLSVIEFCCFDRNFYRYEYQKNDAMQETGMNQEDLVKSTDTLLDYLQGKRDDIKLEAYVDGEKREVFNQRETLHMIDVKSLYQNAGMVRNLSLLSGIAVVLLEILFHRKQNWKKDIHDCYRYGTSLTIMIIVFLAIAALANFQDFWYHFHELFFDNSLWLLDPNTSIMINMFPGSFFFDLVIWIIITYIVVLVLLTLFMDQITKVRKQKCL